MERYVPPRESECGGKMPQIFRVNTYKKLHVGITQNSAFLIVRTLIMQYKTKNCTFSKLMRNF